MSSSLLNVSNASSKSEEFSLKDIKVFVDSREQNWFKRAPVGKFLGLINIHGLTRRLPESDRLARRDISTKWDQQKTADIFFIKVRPFLCDNKCRKPTPNLVNLKFLGIELYKNKWLCEEQDALGQSMQALRGEEMIHQFGAGKYRIGLYFPKYKLAIECYEFGYRDRDIGTK